MSIINRMRKQTAVYWAQGAPDDEGQTSFSSGVEIECRWEEKAEEFLDDQMEKQVSSSVVYVDRDMRPGDFLILSDLESLDSETVPKSNTGAAIIRGWAKIPNLKNTQQLRIAYL